MNRLVVTLKQHTPLIHFQHYQDGAVLRATELKPKLDRYIIKECFKDNFDEYKKFLIGYKEGADISNLKDRTALDYKVKIFNVKNRVVRDIEIKYNDEKGKPKIKPFPLFFGNMNVNDEYKKKKFVFCDSLDIEFFSFNENLINKIIEILPSFFMHNNFGMRQSKGFGSFFINENGEYVLNGETKKYTNRQIANAKHLKYKFTVKNTENYNNRFQISIYKNLFEKIERFYKSLRSGLTKFDKQGNIVTIPPCIQLYAVSKKIQWEKDTIKQTYGSNNYNINNNYEKLLMKDLFGLSTFENWRQQRWKITKEDCSEDKITRFKSPILFKPLMNKDGSFDVYFEAKEIDKRFLNRKFKIKCNGSGNLTLKTPKQFDFDDFFKFVKQQANNNFPKDIRDMYSLL